MFPQKTLPDSACQKSSWTTCSEDKVLLTLNCQSLDVLSYSSELLCDGKLAISRGSNLVSYRVLSTFTHHLAWKHLLLLIMQIQEVYKFLDCDTLGWCALTMQFKLVCRLIEFMCLMIIQKEYIQTCFYLLVQKLYGSVNKL